MNDIVTLKEVEQSVAPTTKENGVLFCLGDESTYPPEFTFVVTNIQDQPAYFDRKSLTWWTAKADHFGGDIYGRNDFYHFEDDMVLYWQPITFKKADVLFIPADSEK